MVTIKKQLTYEKKNYSKIPQTISDNKENKRNGKYSDARSNIEYKVLSKTVRKTRARK